MGEVAVLHQQNNSLSIFDDIDIDFLARTMQRVNTLQAYFQKALKQDFDYGIIPGTNKPTLLKPGAEKILGTLGITSEYEIVEKIQDYDRGVFAFTVKCVLSKNGYKITEGFGHCNTKEGKYRWRWVTEKKLPEGTITDGLIKRKKTGKFGDYIEYQLENDDPYTLTNTCLKMAKKRAQIDATLTVASLSEIFTQDIEDMDLEGNIGSGYNPENAEPANMICTFGKHKGQTLGQILQEDKGYIEWLAKEGQNQKLKNAAKQLLAKTKKEADQPDPAEPAATEAEHEDQFFADDLPF